jgi:hypothetical protein
MGGVASALNPCNWGGCSHPPLSRSSATNLNNKLDLDLDVTDDWINDYPYKTSIKGWSPNYKNKLGQLVGEDGLPDRDPENYPFWIRRFADIKEDELIHIAWGPGGNDANYRGDIYRIKEIDGYVSLGDIWAGYPSDDSSKQKQQNLRVVMVKRFSSDPDRPYAKKVKQAKFLNILNKVGGYCKAGGYDCCGNYSTLNRCIAPGMEFPSCGFDVKGQEWRENWDAGAGLTVYKPYDTLGGHYLSVGCIVQGLLGNPIGVYNVRKDLVHNMKGNEKYYTDTIKNEFIWNSTNTSLGRRFTDATNSRRGCNYSIWSTAMIFDRKNNNPTPLMLHTFDGYFSGNLESWNLDDDNKEKIYFYYMNFYLLKPISLIKYCCETTTDSDQCNWGNNKLEKGSPECLDYYRQICVASNEEVLVKSGDDGGQCLNQDVCINVGDPQNKGKINCDYEFRILCNKTDEKGVYVNLIKYPDICSCHVGGDFLKSACDETANKLGLKNNKPAMKVLNIDTSDDNQCTQNCTVIDLCREGKIMTKRPKTATSGRDYPIQKGGITNLSKCGDLNLCIQEATINMDGTSKLGEIKIRQDAKCGTYNKGVCQNSKFGSCTINQGGKFYKRLIEELDNGACSQGKPLSEVEPFLCAEFDQTPIYDSCNSGKKNTIYVQKKDDAITKDVLDALNTLVPKDGNGKPLFGAYPYYSDSTRLGVITSLCQDCVLDYEPKKVNGVEIDCVLRGNSWKQLMSYTKLKFPKLNGGQDCPPLNSQPEKEFSCLKDKDCEISLKENESGCVDGKKTIRYNIDKINSGNGKDCKKAILDVLPATFKTNYPSISISNDIAKVEVSCENCETGYQVDLNSNDGNCYYSDGKWIIKKIPVFTRKESGAGFCEESKVKLVKDAIPIYEECNKNQDCKFNTKPILDECDKNTGIRTLKFALEIPSNGDGLSCEDVGQLLGKQYTDLNENIVYSNSEKILTVQTMCDVSQDCDIDLNPIHSFCGVNNKNVEIFKINTEDRNNGKECGQVIEEYYNSKGKILSASDSMGKDGFTTIKKDDKIYVYTECGESKNEAVDKILKIFKIIMIFYIAFLLIKLIL